MPAAADPPSPFRSVAAPGPVALLSWRLVGADAGRLRIELRGEINENCDLSELERVMQGEVELDLQGITRINSCGVREWVNFMRGLGEVVKELRFVRCSPTVVSQLNTIYNFRGRARVLSFFAPYVCEGCRHDELRLLDIAQDFGESRRQAPSFSCARCGGVLVFDELPERYFSFLAEEGSR